MRAAPSSPRSRACLGEGAAEPARAAGIRVVHPRIGVVITPRGGILQKLRLPFRLGVGGVVGSGRQWMSWIHLDDLVRLLVLALEDDELEGPFNAVAPEPVTNREFTKTLGAHLSRPTILPAPAFALRLALGEMANELLLASTRASASRLVERGFTFRYPDLAGALAAD